MKLRAMKLKCALTVVSAFAMTACATTPNVNAPLPREVRAARQAFVDDCKPDAPVFASDLILQADLNGDGRDDYVVNGFAYQCRKDTPYCGSAGCEVQIYMSAPAGLLEQRFDGYLQEPPRVSRRLGKAQIIAGAGPNAQIFDPRTMLFAPVRR